MILTLTKNDPKKDCTFLLDLHVFENDGDSKGKNKIKGLRISPDMFLWDPGRCVFHLCLPVFFSGSSVQITVTQVSLSLSFLPSSFFSSSFFHLLFLEEDFFYPPKLIEFLIFDVMISLRFY